MLFGTGWTDGFVCTSLYSTYDIGVLGRFFLSKEQGVPGFSGSILHPDDVETTIQQLTQATDAEVKKSLQWQLQSLMADKYCLWTPVVDLNNIAAKSVKVQNDYLSEPATDKTGTYADCWIKK